MPKTLDPLRFLLLAVAGWVNQEQQHAIAYLREENRILRVHLGPRRLRFTDEQRLSLALREELDMRVISVYRTGGCSAANEPGGCPTRTGSPSWQTHWGGSIGMAAGDDATRAGQPLKISQILWIMVADRGAGGCSVQTNLSLPTMNRFIYLLVV